MVMELNRDNYKAEVNGSKGLMLVDFWGPRCVPCLALMPGVEALEKTYEGKMKIAKVNSAENRMLCARLRVMALPSFILYKDGAEVTRITGEATKMDHIKEAVEKALKD
jgi:thioredoxin 1